MEISSSSSGIVFRRPIPCGSKFSGLSTSAAFSGGHLNYYHHHHKNKITTTTTTKKKLKLLKSLSKDLSMFSDFDPCNAFFLGRVQGNIVSEAADALLRQPQQVGAEEKELKRKKKLDKAQLKAATRMTTTLQFDSSSSSGSNDSEECPNKEVIQMSRLRNENEKEACFVQPIIVHELEAGTLEESTSSSTLPSSLTQEEANTTTTNNESSFEDHSTTENHAVQSTATSSSSNVVVCDGLGNGLLVLTAGLSSKRIEVCMGGKCKKSGGAELLEEFERAIGSSNVVVGCKCMGKCKNGPNVRVLNCFDGVEEAQGLNDDSSRTPTNPLYIGVGLADVGVILANFFGEDGSFAPTA